MNIVYDEFNSDTWETPVNHAVQEDFTSSFINGLGVIFVTVCALEFTVKVAKYAYNRFSQPNADVPAAPIVAAVSVPVKPPTASDSYQIKSKFWSDVLIPTFDEIEAACEMTNAPGLLTHSKIQYQMENSHRTIYKIQHSKSSFVRIVMRALYEVVNFFFCGLIRGCFDKKKVVTVEDVGETMRIAFEQRIDLCMPVILKMRNPS